MSGRWFQSDETQRPTVGDWVVVRDGLVQRLLDRRNLLTRMHPGRPNEVQLLGANVDLLIVVSSCNDEFNPARLERYLALAEASGVEPLIVLTKVDLAPRAETFVSAAEALPGQPSVLAVNALDPDSVAPLSARTAPGQTVALVGSSGVGKSTLLNALAGEARNRTGAIREEDGKGRHTTTHRSLHLLPSGVLVLDSPGIRELALSGADEGVQDLFEDVQQLVQSCRFNNCAHESEPGCAVRAAIADATISEKRVARYLKLLAEGAENDRRVAQRRPRVRRSGAKRTRKPKQ